jgi:hypothetical protein
VQCKFWRSYKKVVPKGAQCKYSAQKSFQRECRAKYRRNIRRRSSKDVLKEMQNLHRKVNGDTAEIEGEEVQKMFLRGCRTYTKNKWWSRKINDKEIPIVPKGTQRWCVQVWACGCVSSALASSFASYRHIIPHSITSYIILHDTNWIRSRPSETAL